MISRPLPENNNDLDLGCSVIIPCYNEAGNIEEAVRRIPKIGKETEIVLVNDGSTDETFNVMQRLKTNNPNLKVISYSENKGKGFAVKKGFEEANQEILMILDADMSVPPEELPKFFYLLNEGICDFANGTRMVYPMEGQAMHYLNLIGNKLYALIMSFILGQKITDTLCGTKALYKKDFLNMKMGKDKWGDFDLLLGAANLKSKIAEVPIHYKMRKSGKSKMKALKHGFNFLTVCFRGFIELVLTR